MQSQKLSIGFAVLVAIFAVTTLMKATPAAAQTEKVLYGFNQVNAAGLNPAAGLVSDADGNLYGTTYDGNGNGAKGGSVFELTKMCGAWTEKTLHRFGNGNDGYNPSGSLIFDSVGNLYGTTPDGGAHNEGIVFELSPTTGGGWTEKLLYNFGSSGDDGVSPMAAVIFDASGNLYGTTFGGGLNGGGTVFELTPTASGGWAEKTLFSFGALGTGAGSVGGLIFDAAGNLYGTAGNVFELSPTGSGDWTEKVLHTFQGFPGDGFTPTGNLIFDGDGNLYGTTVDGGSASCENNSRTGSCGTVFELTPAAGGEWTESILYNFQGSPTDGSNPVDGVVFDASGNLFGTTNAGGNGKTCLFPVVGCGAVFELTPSTGGLWSEKVLYVFGGKDDGYFPLASLIFDGDRTHLYGTTSEGGPYSPGFDRGGTVFEITP
jgi:uncharacterized repeat protein (TIGR03803 family)